MAEDDGEPTCKPATEQQRWTSENILQPQWLKSVMGGQPTPTPKEIDQLSRFCPTCCGPMPWEVASASTEHS